MMDTDREWSSIWQRLLWWQGRLLSPFRPAPRNKARSSSFRIECSGDSTSITIIVLLTLLTLLPALLMSVTPLVRILVIFHFLRQALGTQTAPTNQTLIGLGLFLTYFIMQPVGLAIHQQAVVPFENGRMTTLQALDAGAVRYASSCWNTLAKKI